MRLRVSLWAREARRSSDAAARMGASFLRARVPVLAESEAREKGRVSMDEKRRLWKISVNFD